jgi:hypothetical protein
MIEKRNSATEYTEFYFFCDEPITLDKTLYRQHSLNKDDDQNDKCHCRSSADSSQNDSSCSRQDANWRTCVGVYSPGDGTYCSKACDYLPLTGNLFLLIKNAVCFAQILVSVIATMAGVKKTIVRITQTTVTVAQTARQSAVIFTVCRSAPGRLIQPGCSETSGFSLAS